MRVLIVDDDRVFVELMAEQLVRKTGVQVLTWSPPDMETYSPNGKWVELDVISAVKQADVIFLDHKMPDETGEQLLTSWKEVGLISKQRIIGISSNPQPYLKEHVGENSGNPANWLKFLS